MARYIITGCFTAAAMKGMIAKPADREGAVRPLIEASGGKFVSYMVTTGDTDFMLTVETDDASKLMAALMVTGASGAVANLKTVQAFTTAEFLASQKAAAALVASYTAPA
jgi:uncharacterized protein with GYD domain